VSRHGTATASLHSGDVRLVQSRREVSDVICSPAGRVPVRRDVGSAPGSLAAWPDPERGRVAGANPRDLCSICSGPDATKGGDDTCSPNGAHGEPHSTGQIERRAGGKCLQSGRQTSVRASRRGLLNDPISARGLIGFMAADDAARGSAEDAMTTGKVPRSAAHQRASMQPLASAGGAMLNANERKRYCGASNHLLHQSLRVIETVPHRPRVFRGPGSLR
jgi:hypothetical protein